ncbi:universal stress protein [Streptomyces sp. MS1.HAVA.3]|uniref:Universal stress protein n=1 Tax=Streptomyces caledonius TaxID=3134107 RepID=A0ABU8U0J6_9ACTN
MEGNTGGPELGSVVVGIDGSESAEQAAFWGAAEAVRRDVPLHLIYAADTEGRALYISAQSIERVRQAGRALLDSTAAAVQERHPEVRVTAELGRGAPVPSLHRAAGIRGTVVIGNRGLGGFGSLMLGSVGLKLAAAATTPVVIVREADDKSETGNVLAGIRDEHDLDVARYAAREAGLRKASLRLVHVWNVLQSVGNVVTMLDDVDEIAGRHVHRLMAVSDLIRDEFPDLTVQADAEKSVSPAGVLVQASNHADLLVVGGRRSPGYIGPTLGRVTHSLIHHAHCPVQLIPRHEATHGGDE